MQVHESPGMHLLIIPSFFPGPRNKTDPLANATDSSPMAATVQLCVPVTLVATWAATHLLKVLPSSWHPKQSGIGARSLEDPNAFFGSHSIAYGIPACAR